MGRIVGLIEQLVIVGIDYLYKAGAGAGDKELIEYWTYRITHA